MCDLAFLQFLKNSQNIPHFNGCEHYYKSAVEWE